ncbi:ComF family protein [Faunimonas sp. B44]|uniref:ComF family protein n=1 Tax=Faunimonas sp. B44 TaxID=3461493 RepID=UPI0040449384
MLAVKDRLPPVARFALRRAIDLVMPPVCPVCRSAIADPHALCARCWSGMRFIGQPLCPVYGTPFAYDLGEGAISPEAMADPPLFRSARAVAIYDGPARALVHAMKYRDHPELARMMAEAMARAGYDLVASADLIVPVPLHRWRLWRRRFNQSALLAAAIATQAGKPCSLAALARVKPTRQQVGLSAAQRLANVQGAFRVPGAERPAVAGHAILLVDDVYTSGATAKAATRALLRAGARSVDVLTFARVAN